LLRKTNKAMAEAAFDRSHSHSCAFLARFSIAKGPQVIENSWDRRWL